MYSHCTDLLNFSITSYKGVQIFKKFFQEVALTWELGILTWYTCGLKRNGPGRAAVALVVVIVGVAVAACLWLVLSCCWDPFALQLSVMILEGLDRAQMFYFARDLVPRGNNSLSEKISPHLQSAISLPQA